MSREGFSLRASVPAQTAPAHTPRSVVPAQGAGPPFRVLQFPKFGRNPYQWLLAEELAKIGISTEFTGSLKRMAAAVHRREVDALHIHWTHVLLRDRPALALLRAGRFLQLLLAARARDIRVVWTLHNLAAHDGKMPRIDAALSRQTARLAQSIVVHGPAGRAAAIREFNAAPNKVVIVPHGNYAPIQAPCPPLSHAGPVRFLAWGQIRSYKGFSDLLASFAMLEAGELLIAGQAREAHEVAQLEAQAAATPRATLALGSLSAEDLEARLAATDFVVLPYRQILTSGVLLMSLTAGRPVILPALGDLPSYVTEACAILYDPSDPEGLTTALRTAAGLPPATRRAMQRAAETTARGYAWPDAAAQTAAVYGAEIRTH